MWPWNCSTPFLFWFALLQNNFMLTNLTKRANQHCCALEILKKISICLNSFSCKAPIIKKLPKWSMICNYLLLTFYYKYGSYRCSVQKNLIECQIYFFHHIFDFSCNENILGRICCTVLINENWGIFFQIVLLIEQYV